MCKDPQPIKLCWLSGGTVESIDCPQFKLLESDFLLGRDRVEVETMWVAHSALHFALEVLENSFLLGCNEHVSGGERRVVPTRQSAVP